MPVTFFRGRWVAGALAASTGVLVLIGWAFDIPGLKSLNPGWVAMKANTALGFILLGAALLAAEADEADAGGGFSVAARFCALAAGLLGFLTLLQYLTGVGLGIDQLLFVEAPGTIPAAHLGRMAPNSALCFILLGAALSLQSAKIKVLEAVSLPALLAALAAALGLGAVISYLHLDSGSLGWAGKTPMAAHTGGLFLALGAAIIAGERRNLAGSTRVDFSKHLRLKIVTATGLAVSFILYSAAQRQSDIANLSRYRSFLLADELRHSGDDLTRMARTYVATGDAVYKRRFQDILEIRDGIRPRPENYSRPYWDLMLKDGVVPRPTGAPAVALLELMRQAGFTEAEFHKLEEAKANSDALTAPEREAMALVESTGPRASADRAKALNLLFDERYHLAKAGVMGPINDFMAMVDERTRVSVAAAQGRAEVFRYFLALFILSLCFVLWRAYVALSRTLGGSVEEVHSHLARIGGGDFSAPLTQPEGSNDTVLAWLAQMQAKLGDSAAALQKSQSLLTQAEKLGKVGGWEIDVETKQLAWTETVYDIHELDSTGRATVEQGVNFYTPASRPIIEQALRRAIEKGEPFDVELEIITAKGNLRSVHAIGKADLAGRKVAGFFQDITERKRAEGDIRRLNAELEQRVAVRTAQLESINKELEAFCYSVSHDLRAPLRSIDGFSLALLEDYEMKLDAEGQQHLHRIRGSAQFMGVLIDDMLKLSRLSRVKFTSQSLDLSALVSAVAGNLKEAHPDRAVECIIEKGVTVDGDAHLLRLVLENLIGNAWKFTGKQPKAKVEFGVVRSGGEAVHFVRDNGAGFDMKYSNKLFGAFQRLHTTEEFPGTGIGLVTVQRILARHGGRVWAEAGPGKGATFYFTLGTLKEA